jgi:hypothetical protein
MALSNSLHQALVEFVGTLKDDSDERSLVIGDLEKLGAASGTLSDYEDAAHGILSRLYGGSAKDLSQRSGNPDVQAPGSTKDDREPIGGGPA